MKKRLLVFIILFLMIIGLYAVTYAKYDIYNYYRRRSFEDKHYLTDIAPDTSVEAFLKKVIGDDQNNRNFGVTVVWIKDGNGNVVVSQNADDVLRVDNDNILETDIYGSKYCYSSAVDISKLLVKTGYSVKIRTTYIRNIGTEHYEGENEDEERIIIVYGDIDCDGKHTYKDVLLLDDYLKGNNSNT